jgi:hypothetical protein
MKRSGQPDAMMRQMRQPMMVVMTAPSRPVLRNSWKPCEALKEVEPAKICERERKGVRTIARWSASARE